MPEATKGARAPRTLPDRLLGLLGGGMVLVALVLLVAGGEGDGGAEAAPAAVPAIELVEAGGAGEGGFSLVFRVEEEIRPGAGGWGTDSLHLHLELNGIEFMPSPADIQRLPSGAYRWTLAPPPAGEHTLRLFWSGENHRPLTAGASEPMRVRIE